MVAGHAISRPRIQLERVDLASMAQVGEQQQVGEVEEVLEDPVTLTEDIADELEEVPPSPITDGNSADVKEHL